MEQQDNTPAEKEEKPDFKEPDFYTMAMEKFPFIIDKRLLVTAFRIVWHEHVQPLQQEITTLREALARLEKVVDCMKVPKPKSENESFYRALDHYNELRRDIEL